MKAIQYTQFQQTPKIVQVPDPTVPTDGVVLRVEATGICRSDWHGWMGHDPDVTCPQIPGHELAGTVVETGSDVANWKVGDRVTVPFCMGCGSCPQCAAGNHQVCDAHYQPGFTGPGSFAEYIALPRADVNLVELPADMAFEHAASLGCRFVTAFRGIVHQGRLQSGEILAVHGCGGVGLSAIMIGKAIGATVIGVDRNDAALEMAQQLGADHCLKAREDRIPKQIKKLTNGGAHVSLDALGSSETCSGSIACLRKQGRHIQIGLMMDRHANASALWPRVIAFELQIYGSHGMSPVEYPRMFDMIEGGQLFPEKLVTQTIRLGDAISVLTNMAQTPPAGLTVINDFS